MVDSSLLVANPDHGPESIPAFRHWIHGFMLQTIVYGINIVLFVTSIWILVIHISKGTATNRFHKYHLFQNVIFLAYIIGMFALSSLLMGHQGIMAEDAWLKFMTPNVNSLDEIVLLVFEDRLALQKACNVIVVFVNWGTVALLLWRCTLHWKVRSIFPCKVLLLPYLGFAACIITGCIRAVHDATPQLLPSSMRDENWALIHWSIATSLYYLLSLLIASRIAYHRFIVGRQLRTTDINRFTSGLTIVYESGLIVLIFATINLIILSRFPDLSYLFETTTVQIQVMLSLSLIHRICTGKAWSGKTIDCLLHTQKNPDNRAEEISTMGFHPNTEVSFTHQDYVSEQSTSPKAQHEFAIELELRSDVMRDKDKV